MSVRAAGAELMDEPQLDWVEIRAALADLAGVNRWLGGWRVLRREMASLLETLPPAPYTAVDVGTGGADLPLRLTRWAKQRGYRLKILATDLHPQTLELARAATRADPDVQVAPADALSLPFPDGHFDFALCSTTLHHFDDQDAVRVIAELARVARRGVVVNDLRRSRAAYWGARLLALTAWRRHRLTRHDGPLSVRRAFTPAELRRAAARAGLPDAHVARHFPFRLSLTSRLASRSAGK